MFPYTALAANKTWQPGPYPGVELMILHKNETTGGVSVLRKFHAGMTIPAHVHPLANEFVYILSGEWEESGVTYHPGTFFHAPRRAPRSAYRQNRSDQPHDVRRPPYGAILNSLRCFEHAEQVRQRWE